MREADSVVRARWPPAWRTAACARSERRASLPPVRQRARRTTLAQSSQIKRMDMEARSLPADRARGLTSKVKEYKADLNSLREQLKQAAAMAGASDAARAELVRRTGPPAVARLPCG
jgi:hypothetical protein